MATNNVNKQKEWKEPPKIKINLHVEWDQVSGAGHACATHLNIGVDEVRPGRNFWIIWDLHNFFTTSPNRFAAFLLARELWNRNFVSFHFICFCCWIDTIADSMNLCRRFIFNFVVRRHWIDLPVSCRIHGRAARVWLMSCTIWLNSLIRFTFARVGFAACQRFCTASEDDLGEMDWCWRKEEKKRWFSSENSDEAGRENLSPTSVCHARATDFRRSTRVNCIRINFRGAFEVTSSYNYKIHCQLTTCNFTLD